MSECGPRAKQICESLAKSKILISSPTQGGIKAVVFTDAWQVVVMFISVVIVVILGTIAIGGPEIIWDRSEVGGRLEFFK